MSAKNVEIARRKLRLQILDAFPNTPSAAIYDQLKKKERQNLFFEDFESIATIDKSLFPDIFLCYNVSSTRIKKDQFVRFLEDGVQTGEYCADVPASMSDEQIAILDRFCKTLKSRKTQGLAPSMCSGAMERSSVSHLWINLCRMSPNREKVTHVRVASLCQIAADLNMSFTASELIDALFTFFGTTFESLDFAQFTRMMETF